MLMGGILPIIFASLIEYCVTSNSFQIGVYDVKMLNKSCSEFGGWQLNVYNTIWNRNSRQSTCCLQMWSCSPQIAFLWLISHILKFDYKLIFATLKINSLCWVFLAMRCDAIQSIWTSQIRHVIRSAILLFCYLLPWRNAFFGCVSCLGFIGNLVI